MKLERFETLAEANAFAAQFDDSNSSLMVKTIRPAEENGKTVFYVAVDNRTFGTTSKDRSNDRNSTFRK